MQRWINIMLEIFFSIVKTFMAPILQLQYPSIPSIHFSHTSYVSTFRHPPALAMCQLLGPAMDEAQNAFTHPLHGVLDFWRDLGAVAKVRPLDSENEQPHG